MQDGAHIQAVEAGGIGITSTPGGADLGGGGGSGGRNAAATAIPGGTSNFGGGGGAGATTSTTANGGISVLGGNGGNSVTSGTGGAGGVRGGGGRWFWHRDWRQRWPWGSKGLGYKIMRKLLVIDNKVKNIIELEDR